MQVTSASLPTAGDHVAVYMLAVYSDVPGSENKAFTDATPSASVILNIHKDKPAAAFFEVGREYYVDFSKAAA
jgi:hypothetical protein